MNLRFLNVCNKFIYLTDFSCSKSTHDIYIYIYIFPATRFGIPTVPKYVERKLSINCFWFWCTKSWLNKLNLTSCTVHTKLRFCNNGAR